MDHLTPEQLHLLLAGELDPEEGARVTEHLTHCGRCESLLAAIAADDSALSDALALTAEEITWVGAQDLRTAVAKQIAPWFLQPQGLLLLLLMLSTAGWMLQETSALLTRAITLTGPVSVALALLEGLGRLAWGFLNYVGSGGPLAALWPLLLLVALFAWIQRRKGSHA